MTDELFKDIRALASEHGAITAFWLAGPGVPPEPVIVRCFRGVTGVRLTIDFSPDESRQMVLDPAALCRLLDDPLEMPQT